MTSLFIDVEAEYTCFARVTAFDVRSTARVRTFTFSIQASRSRRDVSRRASVALLDVVNNLTSSSASVRSALALSRSTREINRSAKRAAACE